MSHPPDSFAFSPPPRWRVWLPVLLAFAAFALVQTPGLLNGGFRWDESFSEYIPWRVEAGRQLAQGHFPFFTSKVFGGMPIFATSYTGVLYPPNWLYIVSPPWISNVLAFFHSFMGALGMFVYLRSRRFVPFVAVAGGLLFAANSFWISHWAHISMRETGLMAPWVVWLARRLMRQPGPERAVAFSLALGVQIAIGYQQIYLFTVLWIVLEGIGTLRWRWLSLRATLWMAAGGALGTGLMGAQLFSSLRLIESTPRAAMTPELWMASSFSPSHVLFFLSPRAFGYMRYFGDGYASELVVAIPSFAWALALLAVVFWVLRRRVRGGPRGRAIVLFALGAVAAYLLALGEHFPPYRHLFGVPPFSFFRIPSRYLFLATTFGVILGAHGMQELLRSAAWKRLGWFLAAWAAFAALIIGLALVFRNSPSGTAAATDGFWRQAFFSSPPDVRHMDATLRRLGLPGAGGFFDLTGIHALISVLLGGALLFCRRVPLAAGMVVLALLCLDTKILQRHALFEPGRPREILNADANPLFPERVQDDVVRLYSLSPDANTVGYLAYPHLTFLFPGYRSLNGYGPLLNMQLERYVGLANVGVGFRDSRLLCNPAPLRHLAVSHLVVERSRFDESDALCHARNLGHEFRVVQWHRGFDLLEIKNTRPRFDYAKRWRPMDEQEMENFLFWHDPSKPEADTVLADPQWKELPPVESELTPPGIKVLADEPSYQKVRIDAPPEGSILLVRDVHWPGWEYRLADSGDGWEDMGVANGLLRYAPVPGGPHTVEMRYRPPGWRTGLRVSLGAALVLAAIFIGAMWRRFHTRRVSVS